MDQQQSSRPVVGSDHKMWWSPADFYGEFLSQVFRITVPAMGAWPVSGACRHSARGNLWQVTSATIWIDLQVCLWPASGVGASVCEGKAEPMSTR